MATATAHPSPTASTRPHLLLRGWGVCAVLLAAPWASADPLATCEVKVLKTESTSTMSGVNNPLLIDAAADDPMLDYHPHREPSSEQPAANPGMLRLLITGPGPGPARVIELTVLIDGEPFRAKRDQWINSLIKQAPAERQVRDAGKAVSSAISTLSDMVNVSPPDSDTTKVRVRSTPTLRSRMTQFLAAVGTDVDRREVVSLMNQWPSGPAVTVLSPARSWQRAGDAPLLAVLDKDGNNELSDQEFLAAANNLSAADVNQDGIVELGELRRRGRRRSTRAAGRLITVIDPAGDWKRLYGPVNGRLDWEKIANGPPDAQGVVRFGAESEVELLSLAGVPPEAVQASHDLLNIDFGSEHFELSAVQTANAPNQQDAPEQIAVGAVVDGRPLMRLLDGDNDRRLTAREQRRLPNLLASLDHDKDGALSRQEIPTAVRIVIGRGAVVHRLLDQPTVSIRKLGDGEPTVAAPEWFTPMDANRDGELARDEFPGDNEQFRALDTDGNGFITVAEAAAFDAN